MPQQINTNTKESNNTLKCFEKNLIISQVTGNIKDATTERKNTYMHTYRVAFFSILAEGILSFGGWGVATPPAPLLPAVCYIYALKLTSAIISMVQMIYFLALMKVTFAVNCTFTC